MHPVLKKSLTGCITIAKVLVSLYRQRNEHGALTHAFTRKGTMPVHRNAAVRALAFPVRER